MEHNCAPVVVNKYMKDNEITKYFLTGNFKVKISNTTQKNSIIFPKSSLAFTIYQVQEVANDIFYDGKENETPPANLGFAILDKNVLSNLSHFSSVNRKSYVVLMAAKFNKREIMIFTALQEYFMMTNLNILVAHSAQECVECISAMADATTKESIAKTKERIDQILQGKSQNTDYIANALMCAGVGQDDVYTVHHGCVSLANVVTANSKEYLLEHTNLDDATATAVFNFFERNTFQL